MNNYVYGCWTIDIQEIQNVVPVVRVLLRMVRVVLQWQYSPDKDGIPIVIQCVVDEEGNYNCLQLVIN